MSPNAYYEMAETELAHWWFRGRRDIVCATISSLGLPANASILEIGAGTGGNLDMLARFGKVSAIEMDMTARRMAHTKTGGRYDIRAGHCPDHMPLFADTFDLICFLDCLEHIADDVGALAAARRLLQPNGRILVTVPAYQWLWSRHDESLHHHRRYSRATLQSVIAGSGNLAIERMTYFNTILFPLAVVARLKDKLSGSAVVTGTSVPAAPFNAALHWLFSAERHWLANAPLPFGVSLLAILRAH